MNERPTGDWFPRWFKLLPCDSQMLLAHSESYHAKRSEFGSHAVRMARHDDEEKLRSGRHTMQSLGGDGITTIIRKRRDSGNSPVRNDDIVVEHTFGSAHNLRIEDWPVMPSQKMIVGFKSVNSFTGNLGLDIAVSTWEKR